MLDGFTSIEELYKRCEPALKSKEKDLKRVGVDYVQRADIWNYLKENIWSKKSNLSLGEIVNDIMCTPNIEFELYVQKLFSKEQRKIVDDNLL